MKLQNLTVLLTSQSLRELYEPVTDPRPLETDGHSDHFADNEHWNHDVGGCLLRQILVRHRVARAETRVSIVATLPVGRVVRVFRGSEK